jgi:hypothetical protein
MRARHARPASAPRCAFAGFRSPNVTVVAIRWYLHFGLPYRNVEELPAERGRGQPCPPSTAGASVHATAGRGCSALPVSGRRLLVHGRDPCEGRRAVAVRVPGQSTSWGRYIDVFASIRARHHGGPPVLRAHHQPTKRRDGDRRRPRVVVPAKLKALLPATWHRTDRYGTNRVEAGHGWLKARAATLPL